MSGNWSYAHHADGMPGRQTLSTKEAVAQAGVTYRQADHWLRTGTITIGGPATPGGGKARQWSEDDVVVLRVLGRISRGLNGQPDRQVLTTAAAATRTLIASGWIGDPVYIDLPEGVQLIVETT